GGSRFLDHDPGMMGEDAAPPAYPRRVDRDDRLRGGRGFGQEMGARPIGRTPARRHIVARRPPQGVSREGEDEEDQDEEKGAGDNQEHRSTDEKLATSHQGWPMSQGR